MCHDVPAVREFSNEGGYACLQTSDDWRTSSCQNKGNRSLIEVLKTDLECGWSCAARVSGGLLVLVAVLVVGGFE